eukprot:m.40236 g.40236  ORF g.40236 m.40236 type:complete len:125 (+) comp32930_c0_seq16:1576-1950(+)
MKVEATYVKKKRLSECLPAGYLKTIRKRSLPQNSKKADPSINNSPAVATTSIFDSNDQEEEAVAGNQTATHQRKKPRVEERLDDQHSLANQADKVKVERIVQTGPPPVGMNAEENRKDGEGANK